MQPEISRLTEYQVKRKTYIKAVNRLRNQAEATVRLALHFDPNADEAAREKLNIKAKKIATAALNGKGCEIAGIEEDLMVFGQAMAPLKAKRHEYELLMRKIVRKLPIWGLFGEGVRGLGDLGLAVIIAECGDLSKYAGPDKVKRRLGVAPFTKDGVTMACSNWRKKGGLTADDWIAAKYNPRRRAEIYSCVGDPLFRAQLISKEKSGTKHGGAAGPYGQVYIDRRFKTDISHSEWSDGHAKDDALRVMTQQLLVDLWCTWNGRARCQLIPIGDLPAQPLADAA